MTSEKWNEDPDSETSAGRIRAIEFDKLNIRLFGPSDSYLYLKPE